MKGTVRKRCSCPITKNDRNEVVACELPHGSWTFLTTVGVDPATGQRRQVRRSGFATKKEAQRELTALIRGIDKGVTPPKRTVTYESVASEWLEEKSLSIRTVTRENYEAYLKHSVAAFGHKPIADVSRPDVVKLVAKLSAQGKAQSTVTKALFVCSRVLYHALDNGLVARNVSDRIEAVGVARKEGSALTDAEMDTLRDYVGNLRLGAVWGLTLYGLRRSEVLGLRWSDIDFEAGTLSIQRSISAHTTTGARHEPEGNKTDRGTRVLPLPDDALAALKKLKIDSGHAFGDSEDYIAVDQQGVPLRPAMWTRHWKRICANAGTRVFSLHSARHSSVSAMIRSGVPLWIVAKWHGHTVETMLSRYQHTQQDELAAARDYRKDSSIG